MRELLYDAARHYQHGRTLAEADDLTGALEAFEDALRDLHAVQPQRMRDVLLAQVHLSRYRVALAADPEGALQDLRFGYSYARTSREPALQALAQGLWQAHLNEQQAGSRALVNE